MDLFRNLESKVEREFTHEVVQASIVRFAVVLECLANVEKKLVRDVVVLPKLA